MAKIVEPVTFQDLWKLLQAGKELSRELNMAYLVDLYRPSLFMRLKGNFKQLPDHLLTELPRVWNLDEAKVEFREGRPTLALHVLAWAFFSKKELTPKLKALRSKRITCCYWVLSGYKPSVVRGRVVMPTG